MTRRSLIVALIGACGLGAVTFYNNHVLKNTNLIHSYLPVGVFGATLLALIILQPILSRISRSLRWSAAEIAGLITLLMCACGIVGAGLMEHASTLLMMPWHWARTQIAWRGDPPELSLADVQDWGTLARRLAEARTASASNELVRQIALRLSPELLDLAPEVLAHDPQAQAAWLGALNGLLDDPAWTGSLDPSTISRLPRYVRRALNSPAPTMSETRRIRRALLDVALAPMVRPRRPDVLELVPPGLMADPAYADGAGLSLFVAGAGSPAGGFSWRRVPWGAWRRPLLFWGPLIVALCAMLIGLALVLHRQWSEHERLPYPTVEFIRTLLPEGNLPFGEVFRRRLFWIGAVTVLTVHLINYAHAWWPEYVLPVRRSLDLTPLLELVPVFRAGGPFGLFQPTLYFTAIGFAFFLSSDVSLSLGLAPYLYALTAGLATRWGVSFGSGHLQLNIEAQLYAGAYTAMFLVLLHSGRHYYLSILSRCFRGSLGAPADQPAIMGMRLAILGCLVFVALLVSKDIELGTAVLYTAGVVMIFVTVSRLLAEAGVFFLHQHFYPCALLWSFLGTAAVGYEQLLTLGLVTAMLLIDPREVLMPFVVSGLQLADCGGVSIRTVARWGFVAALLAALTAAPVMLYLQYRHGAIRAGHPWFVSTVPRLPFDRAAQMTLVLKSQGQLNQADALQGLASRVQHMTPRPSLTVAFFTTFALVWLFTLCRRRFARWPFHPLMFLVLGTYQSRVLGFSFLVGWAVKSVVMRYGGVHVYQRLKPLMIGMVAGEVLAAFVPLAVGVLYSMSTGLAAPMVQILP